MKKYFLLIAIFALVGCASQKPYTYDSLGSCNRIQSESILSVNSFDDEYKYIDAELKDLKKLLDDGKITNVKYLKKVDILEEKAPRKLIKSEGIISSFNNEYNRYVIRIEKTKLSYPLPNPFSSTFRRSNSVYLDLDNFPRLKTFLDKPDSTLDKDDEVKILFTNLDSNNGGFYYSVIAIKIGNNTFTHKNYCSIISF